MKNTQGFNPIDDLLSAQDKLALTPAHSSRPNFSEYLEQKLNIDGNPLVKNILFVCQKCDGPLAPSSSCVVCKRTSLRKCTKCGNEVHNGLHESCEYLSLFGKLRSNKLSKKRKKEVDI